MGLDFLQHGFENPGIAGDHMAGFQVIRFAGDTADQAPGLFNQQYSGGDIPQVQAQFPEAIESATGHIGKVQGCRTGTTNTGTAGNQVLHHVEVGVVPFGLGFTKRNTGAEQWETTFDDVIAAPPLIVGDNVFVGTLGEELVGMSVSTGEVSWRTELDGRVKSAMAVADGGLLVLTEPKWVMYFKPAGSSEDSESGTEATE